MWWTRFFHKKHVPLTGRGSRRTRSLCLCGHFIGLHDVAIACVFSAFVAGTHARRLFVIHATSGVSHHVGSDVIRGTARQRRVRYCSCRSVAFTLVLTTGGVTRVLHSRVTALALVGTARGAPLTRGGGTAGRCYWCSSRSDTGLSQSQDLLAHALVDPRVAFESLASDAY